MVYGFMPSDGCLEGVTDTTPIMFAVASAAAAAAAEVVVAEGGVAVPPTLVLPVAVGVVPFEVVVAKVVAAVGVPVADLLVGVVSVVSASKLTGGRPMTELAMRWRVAGLT